MTPAQQQLSDRLDQLARELRIPAVPTLLAWAVKRLIGKERAAWYAARFAEDGLALAAEAMPGKIDDWFIGKKRDALAAGAADFVGRWIDQTAGPERA